MDVSVGKDIYAQCGKCGAVWHVVGAMDGPRVTKVQCKHCLKYHRYKAVPGEPDVNAAYAKPRKVVAGRSRKAPLNPGTPVVEAALDRPVRIYAMREVFEPGDRVQHPKFGQGVVEATPDAGKMLVCFPDGRRTLAHAR